MRKENEIFILFLFYFSLLLFEIKEDDELSVGKEDEKKEEV